MQEKTAEKEIGSRPVCDYNLYVIFKNLLTAAFPTENTNNCFNNQK